MATCGLEEPGSSIRESFEPVSKCTGQRVAHPTIVLKESGRDNQKGGPRLVRHSRMTRTPSARTLADGYKSKKGSTVRESAGLTAQGCAATLRPHSEQSHSQKARTSSLFEAITIPDSLPMQPAIVPREISPNSVTTALENPMAFQNGNVVPVCPQPRFCRQLTRPGSC
jgi:hypothetical protein